MAASQRDASAAETTAATSLCNLDAVAGVMVSALGAQPGSSQHASTKVSSPAYSLRLKAAPHFARRADPDAADCPRLTRWVPDPARSSSRRAEVAILRRRPLRQSSAPRLRPARPRVAVHSFEPGQAAAWATSARQSTAWCVRELTIRRRGFGRVTPSLVNLPGPSPPHALTGGRPDHPPSFP